jgi:phosphatidylinositol glycan class U
VTFAVMSEDQTPNLGLHWYLFTTMFDQFRLFYVVALNAIPLALSAPLTLGFADDPLVAMTLCLIAISTCAPYPTANDFVTYVSLLSVVAMDDRGNPLVYVKYGAVIAGGFLYVALLSPLTWYMWIHTRVANANFYYAITLVYACTQTLLSTQVARSVARFRRAGKKRD